MSTFLQITPTRFPIKEYRFNSKNDAQTTTDGGSWSDVVGLNLEFGPDDTGNFLVTLSIPGFDTHMADVIDIFVRVVLRPIEEPQPEGTVLIQREIFFLNRTVPLSLVCEANVLPTVSGSQIVVQWSERMQGPATITAGSLWSLSAIGSLQPRRDVFTDPNHFEYPALFSRGLRLTNYTEILFLTGYSSTAASTDTMLEVQPLKEAMRQVHMKPVTQMKWITEHLDEFFKTIPYAHGTGVYSKKDIVYFDLVIDKTVSDKDQTGVLKVLEGWFADVDPKPSTGILKKVEALAFGSTQVEIEFILAH